MKNVRLARKARSLSGSGSTANFCPVQNFPNAVIPRLTFKKPGLNARNAGPTLFIKKPERAKAFMVVPITPNVIMLPGVSQQNEGTVD